MSSLKVEQLALQLVQIEFAQNGAAAGEPELERSFLHVSGVPKRAAREASLRYDLT
jgi:hypothetical protein